MLEKYKTILEEIEEQIVIKKSKFICNIKQVQSEEQALEYIVGIRKRNFDANHHCSAYITDLGLGEVERYNDDKEPSGTAGKPMLEVLKGAGVKNIVAVVTRYFGGIQLGTGGLIRAYSESVKTSLKEAYVYENYLCEKLSLEIEYALLPKVEYLIHKNNQIIYDTIFSDKVKIVVFIECLVVKEMKKEIIETTYGQCVIQSKGFYYVAIVDQKLIIHKLP